MTRSLGYKLLKDEMWEADLCVNKHKCRNIPRLKFYLEIRKWTSHKLVYDNRLVYIWLKQGPLNLFFFRNNYTLK